MDPQIEMSYGTSSYLPERFPAFFESIDDIGDSTGVHPHAWRWDTTTTTRVADHEDSVLDRDVAEKPRPPYRMLAMWRP